MKSRAAGGTVEGWRLDVFDRAGIKEHKEIFAERRTALKCYGYPEEVAHITFSL
jgi:hypothetical protein